MKRLREEKVSGNTRREPVGRISEENSESKEMSMNKPIRILHIVGAMYPGGMENFIMNLYRNIDRSQFQFDFIVHQKRENDYTDEIEQMGGRVYLLPRLTKKPFSNLHEIRKLVRENHYPMVIRHTANALVAPQLLAAKRAGAVTVCHSHNETDPQIRLHRIGQRLMRHAADIRLACSEQAGRWMYGDQSFEVIHNAIDIPAFSYSEEKAATIRREFHLEGKHVYGNIANFIASKNHMYLLRIYREIVNLDPDAVCFCLGEGDLRPEIEEEIQKLHLEGKVILTGIRSDVPDFMSCLDVLVFPSRFEGLPLTLIEAQAAGLPSLISDTITKNVIVTEGIVRQLSIEEKPEVWAETAVRLAMQPHDRTCQKESIAAAGYDIRQLAVWYQEFIRKNIGR